MDLKTKQDYFKSVRLSNWIASNRLDGIDAGRMMVHPCPEGDHTKTIAEFWSEGMYYRIWFHDDGVDSTCHPTGPRGYADHHTYYMRADGVQAICSNSPQYRRG